MSVIRQEELVAEGFDVEVLHYRNVEAEDGTPAGMKPVWTPVEEGYRYCSTGGQTRVLIQRDGEQVEATASCSELDHFNRKRGFQIATGRALKKWHRNLS